MNMERVPPHDIEAEKAVLGSILCDPQQLGRVKPIASSADFYRNSHRAIYQAMLTLDAEGVPPDPLLVKNKLSGNGTPEGTIETMIGLPLEIASPAHASHYAGLVRKAAEKRRMIQSANQILQAAYEDGSDPATIQKTALANLTNDAKPTTLEDLPWRTAEVTDDDYDEPEWLWNRYLACDRITILSGHGGCGKTTLYYGIIGAMLRQNRLLNADTAISPAVILTEESPSDWRPRAKRFGLHGCAWLDRSAMHPRRSLKRYMEAAYRKALAIGAYLIVVDSWSKWAGFAKDEEKDAGAQEQALQPIYAVAGRGMAILIIHHLRKSDGEEGTGLRGSGHLLAAVETSLELRRFAVGRGNDREDLRCLTVAKSRFPDPPPDVVYSHDPSVDAPPTFRVSGDPKTARSQNASRRVVSCVESSSEWIDAKTIKDILGARDQAVRSALARAYTDGAIQRKGSGSRGDPYLYKGLTR